MSLLASGVYGFASHSGTMPRSADAVYGSRLPHPLEIVQLSPIFGPHVRIWVLNSRHQGSLANDGPSAKVARSAHAPPLDSTAFSVRNAPIGYRLRSEMRRDQAGYCNRLQADA